MSWRNLALKNIWRNTRHYLGYLLASTMAVAVFSIFFIFVFNPAIGSLAALQDVAAVMVICIIIVAGFAIFFIFFFHASLLRTRNKEFGILMTLGMTPKQIGRLIFLESVCIALMALVMGILLGVLGTQPFFMAMGAILGLQDAIPFVLPPLALLITSVFFGTVFLIEACLTSWRIARRTPRILILGARTQQTPPRASLMLVLLGFLCIAVAYDLAIQFSRWFVMDALPIVILTIIGTYLLFSQVMVMLLGILRRRSLRGCSLLIVSRLSYRLKDYARMLAVVTTLSACVLTGMGTVYGFLQTVRAGSAGTYPIDVSLLENMAHPHNFTTQQLQNTLRAQHLTIKEQVEATLLSAQVGDLPVSVLSQTNFEALRSAILRAHPDYSARLPAAVPLSGMQAHLYEPPQVPTARRQAKSVTLLPGSRLPLTIGKDTFTLQVDRGGSRVLNTSSEIADRTVVVSDQVYASLQKAAAQADQWHLYGLYFPDNQQTLAAVKILEKQTTDQERVALEDTASLIYVLQLLSALLFAGCFVSLLFLLAAGCALYFKLFTQQEEDRRQFRALARIGLRKREAVSIISVEFLLLFFLPVLVAVVHSSVASLDLIVLMQASAFVSQMIWSSLGVISLVYAVCFAFYYLVALVNYFKRVRVATV